MTIITEIVAVSEHPFKKLDTEVVSAISTANLSLKKTEASRTARVLLVLECFLQVTGYSLRLEHLGTEYFTVLMKKLIGCLLSGKILRGTQVRNEQYARHYGNLHDAIYIVANTTPSIKLNQIMGKKNPLLRKFCGDLSEEVTFKKAESQLWRGWTVSNSKYKQHLKLYPLYDKYGIQFTEKVYTACAAYYSERTTGDIPGLNSFVLFLSCDIYNYTPHQLLHRANHHRIIDELANFHTQYNLGKEEAGLRAVSHEVLINDWNSHFRTVLADYFIPLKIISAPHDGVVTAKDIPMIPGDVSKQAKRINARTRKNNDGILEKYKTLTPIPMHVTDDTTIENIFAQMRQDLKNIVRWSEICIQNIERALNELSAIHCTRTAKIPKTEKSNLSNVMVVAERIKTASIYIEHGFVPDRNFYTHCISPSYQLASTDLSTWLCIPKQEMLTAFTIFLAAHHEEITNSFIDNCIVPDCTRAQGENPKLVSPVLKGSKPRAKNPDQRITLNTETTWAIEVLIRLTDPLRYYLEKNSNIEYASRLFLAAGKGFGEPKPVRSTGMTSTAKAWAKNTDSISRVLYGSSVDPAYLASRMSVNTVRNTSTVLQILDEIDLSIGSQELGHALFDMRLLEHYVPKTVLIYLMRKEVTNWGTMLLVQALNGHPSTARLAGFRTQEALDNYIVNSMHLPYPNKPGSKPIASNSKVVIGIDTNIVSILVSLEMAAGKDYKRATPSTLYWADFCGELRNWLFSENNKDSYLRTVFQEGANMASIDSVRDIAYE